MRIVKADGGGDERQRCEAGFDVCGAEVNTVLDLTKSDIRLT